MLGMIGIKRCIILIVMSVAPLSASAERGAYSCTIKKVYSLGDTGLMSAITNGYMEGDTFSIDRQSGRASGAIKNYNPNAFPCRDGIGLSRCNEPLLIDPGSSEQYFKAITVYGSHNPSVEYLVVEEFAEGSEKPFIHVDGGWVKSGICIKTP